MSYFVCRHLEPVPFPKEAILSWGYTYPYYEAQQVLVSRSQAYRKAAEQIIGDDAPRRENCTTWDHRTLEVATPMLYDVWNFRIVPSLQQLRLPFDGRNIEPPDFRASWLDWLASEMDSWVQRAPQLIKWLLQIIDHQNVPVGYLAEANLCRQLAVYYDGVPWRTRFLDMLDRDVAHSEERLAEHNLQNDHN